MIKCHEQTVMVQTYIHRHPVNKRGNVQTGWNHIFVHPVDATIPFLVKFYPIFIEDKALRDQILQF